MIRRYDLIDIFLIFMSCKKNYCFFSRDLIGWQSESTRITCFMQQVVWCGLVVRSKYPLQTRQC